MTKKNYETKFAYVTNDTTATSIKNHMYHYITPCETAICDSDDATEDCISHQ
jgi:hypothetical protein